IMVGGGAQHASAEVTALAELLEAPVVAYRMGHGVVDARHELCLPFPAGHKLWAEADVVLGIGSRLHSQMLGWGVDDALKIIRVEIDPEEMVRHRARFTPLLGDAAAVTRRLLVVSGSKTASGQGSRTGLPASRPQRAPRLPSCSRRSAISKPFVPSCPRRACSSMSSRRLAT